MNNIRIKTKISNNTIINIFSSPIKTLTNLTIHIKAMVSKFLIIYGNDGSWLSSPKLRV